MKQMIKNNLNVLGLLCLFIIIEPFLDIRPLFTNENLQIFGFTIPTIVRCVFIGLIGLSALKKIENRKDYYTIAAYLAIVIIYTLIHHTVVRSDIVMPPSYTYSLFSELFYIIRMLLPIGIIYFTRYSKIDYNKFIKTILISSLLISLIIFIGNTFCISYTSYETTENRTLVSWLSWFTGNITNYEFNQMTSKGWFYMANQVSGLMVFLFPFCMYDLLKKTTKLNAITCMLMIISMIMVGTRVASYGWLIVSVCLLLLIFYLRVFKKETWWGFSRLKYFFLIVFVGVIFLSVSPVTHRTYGYSLKDLSKLEKEPNQEDTSATYNYIMKNYDLFGIQERYVKTLYPASYDPAFWLDIFTYSKEHGVIENREMQTLISKRIDKLNQGKLKYRLFGYSFSRMRNGGIYMEHDFIVQAYTMGLIGMLILIFPYLWIILLVVIKIFKKLKGQPKLIDFTFVLAICLVLGTSVLSGHIIDELFVMIYIGFACGFFYKRVGSKEIKIYERD